MSGRSGLFGRSDRNDWSGESARASFQAGELIGWPSRLPLEGATHEANNAQAGRFLSPDPTWNTRSQRPADVQDPWLAGNGADTESAQITDVEVLGNGFGISGRLATGRFDRLSDWLNNQSGFVRIKDGTNVRPGRADMPDRRPGDLWVRLDQIALVAQRSAVRRTRPGAPVVQKQRLRVTITTPGYSLDGDIHIHAHGSMGQFLETPEPQFLPVTDLTVSWLSDPGVTSRYVFALINRDQIISVADESAGDEVDSEAGQLPADETPLRLRPWSVA
jgi:hypothetical protein